MAPTLETSSLILIIDDTPANLEVISEALDDAGFEVAIAKSGERAFKQIQFQVPDLILLDVMMPEMDGFAVCRHLKADPATQDIPIIFMTALSDTDSKTQGFELGAVDYITKPFQELEVIARIKTHLQLRHLTKTLEERVAQRTQELQSSQMQLLQSEKLSALGNLVAGVAHEINNPINFIAGNLNPAYQYFTDLFDLIDLYQDHCPQPSEAIQNKIEEIDLEYIRADLSKLISSVKFGVARIKDISTSLRVFSRSDSDRTTLFNIHDGINSTLLILKHRLKATEYRPAIEVSNHYCDLREINCYPGQLNQVFMNLLANAIDALDEKSTQYTLDELQANPNRIIISTNLLDDGTKVMIRIKDNALGMAEEVHARIFDYLFTTKEVGKGTGLGLAIARQIIEEKHSGKLSCHSVLGVGTEFAIEIPIGL